MGMGERLQNAPAPMPDCIGEYSSVYVVVLRGREAVDVLATSTSVGHMLHTHVMLSCTHKG